MGDNESGASILDARSDCHDAALLGGVAVGGAASPRLDSSAARSSKKSDDGGGSIRRPSARRHRQRRHAGRPGQARRHPAHAQAGRALPSMNVFGPSILALAQGLTLGFTVYRPHVVRADRHRRTRSCSSRRRSSSPTT